METQMAGCNTYHTQKKKGGGGKKLDVPINF